MNKKSLVSGLLLCVIVCAIYVVADFTLKTESGDLILDPASGYVGIGTTSPDHILTINSTSYPQVKIQYDDTHYVRLDHRGWFDVYGNHWAVKMEGSSKFLVNTNGYVGIGTTSPGVRLHVYGDGDSNSQIKAERTGALACVNVLGYDYLGTFANRDLRVFANSSEAMRVDTSGNIGIGDTTPDGDLDIGSSYINSGDEHWTVESDSSFKQDITEWEDDNSILEKWLEVSVYDWSYKKDHILEERGIDVSQLSDLEDEMERYKQQVRLLDDDSDLELLGEVNSNLSEITAKINFINNAILAAEKESEVRHSGLMADEFNPLFLGQNKTTLSGDDVMNYLIVGFQQLIRENELLKEELCEKDSSYGFC